MSRSPATPGNGGSLVGERAGQERVLEALSLILAARATTSGLARLGVVVVIPLMSEWLPALGFDLVPHEV